MNTIASLERVEARSYLMTKDIRLGMIELEPNGISEQWFLRYGGDAHWQLIADAYGQKRAVFQDIYGRDVYAAFCATYVDFAFVENLLAESITVRSEIYQISTHQIGSIHQIFLEGRCIANLYMVSSFVSHETSKTNQRIVRNKHMPTIILEKAPSQLVDIAHNARTVARSVSTHAEVGEFIGQAKPCLSLDFNAVGLLYFPTFSKMAETVISEYEGQQNRLKNRSVVYLGNMDIWQKMAFFKSSNQTSIKRCDGKFIANIITERY